MRTVKQEVARQTTVGGAIAAAAVFGLCIYNGNWYGVAMISAIAAVVGAIMFHAWWRERY